MTQTILIRRTSTAGKAPTTASFLAGELALNLNDGKLFAHFNNGVDFVGTIGATQLAGDLTGSITGAAGATTALTLATVNSNVGTFAGLVVNGKGQITAATALNTLAGYGITNGVSTAMLGAANGVATLGSNGLVPTSQLPAAITGAVIYQGTWNASTNSPALASSTGTKGYYYKVSVAGTTTLDGISSWNVGDTAIFDGVTWDKIDGQAIEITSVFGRTGAVVGQVADYAGIYLTGNQPITVTGAATGTGATSIALTLASSGVVAGTYAGISVTSTGLVTAAMTLTTVAGYGITDAMTTSSTVDGGSY